MNNEPVAWMLLRDESCVELTEWFGVMRGWEEFLGDNEKIVELYTHPSEHDLGVAEAIGFDKGYKAATQSNTQLHPTKTLTDEDIEHLVKRWFNCHPESTLDEQLTVPMYSIVTLCKGILKK